MIIVAIQDKFTLTKFSLCITLDQELSMFADSASAMITIPTFANGFKTI